MLKGSGDEGRLTRAPPDHQATCFNIHDITSSLGGPGLHRDEAARSRLLSLEEDRLSFSLSTVIGWSQLQLNIHLLFSLLNWPWVYGWLDNYERKFVAKVNHDFFPPNNDALYAKMTTCWDLNGHYSTAVTGLDQIQHFVHNLRFLLVLVITYRKKLFQLISFIWIWFNNQTHGIHLWLGFQRKSLVIGGFIYSPNDYKTFKNYLVFGEGEVLLYVLRVA